MQERGLALLFQADELLRCAYRHRFPGTLGLSRQPRTSPSRVAKNFHERINSGAELGGSDERCDRGLLHLLAHDVDPTVTGETATRRGGRTAPSR
jgi:hypothetical protein